MNPPSQAAGAPDNPAEIPGSITPENVNKPLYAEGTFKPNSFCECHSHVVVYRHNVGDLFGSLHVSLAHQ